jgi:hypothetical protein
MLLRGSICLQGYQQLHLLSCSVDGEFTLLDCVSCREAMLMIQALCEGFCATFGHGQQHQQPRSIMDVLCNGQSVPPAP